jgi:phage regulator Rha-like protein
MENHSLLLSIDALLNEKMLTINRQQVMTDHDLANLLQITTGQLIKKVKANRKRFSSDFLITLNDQHFSQSAVVEKSIYAFTWGGIMQAVALFNTKRAIDIHLQLVRCYTKRAGVFGILQRIKK